MTSLASRWKPTRSTGQTHSIREKLDDLQMDVVVWCPYEHHKGVKLFTQQAFFSGFIMCGTNVWLYLLERMLKQFGYVHRISQQCLTYEACDITWMECQQDVILLGDVVPPRGPWACTPNYLPLFYRVSHPYAISLEEGEPPYPSVCLWPIPV